MRENHANRSACATLVHAWALMNLLGRLVSTPIQRNRLEPLLGAALARPIRDCKFFQRTGASAPHTWHTTTFWLEFKTYVWMDFTNPERLLRERGRLSPVNLSAISSAADSNLLENGSLEA
jgi:hypothetical protein